MSVRYVFLFVTFATLLAISMEVPIEGSTLPPVPDFDELHQNGSSMTEKDHFEMGNRANHSRMLSTTILGNHSTTLSTTTLGYESWWYVHPTRRPQRPRLYFQDFPGRPGVPSWKEISPGTSLLKLKTQQTKTTPTAASVLNGAQNIAFNFQIALNSFCVVFLLFCFCRP